MRAKRHRGETKATPSVATLLAAAKAASMAASAAASVSMAAARVATTAAASALEAAAAAAVAIAEACAAVAAATESRLEQLPDSLLEGVLRYLDGRQVVTDAARVCKRLRRVALEGIGVAHLALTSEAQLAGFVRALSPRAWAALLTVDVRMQVYPNRVAPDWSKFPAPLERPTRPEWLAPIRGVRCERLRTLRLVERGLEHEETDWQPLFDAVAAGGARALEQLHLHLHHLAGATRLVDVAAHSGALKVLVLANSYRGVTSATLPDTLPTVEALCLDDAHRFPPGPHPRLRHCSTDLAAPAAAAADRPGASAPTWDFGRAAPALQSLSLIRLYGAGPNPAVDRFEQLAAAPTDLPHLCELELDISHYEELLRWQDVWARPTTLGRRAALTALTVRVRSNLEELTERVLRLVFAAFEQLQTLTLVTSARLPPDEWWGAATPPLTLRTIHLVHPPREYWGLTARPATLPAHIGEWRTSHGWASDATTPFSKLYLPAP